MYRYRLKSKPRRKGVCVTPRRHRKPQDIIVLKNLFSVEECEHFLRLLHTQRPQKYLPNSMNRYGARIVNKELRVWISELVADVVDPHAEVHFPEIGRLKKHPYAFSVEYAPAKQKSLASHYDTSDVTLNVCLSHRFKGGDLVFYDKKGKPTREIKHQTGTAIIHRGAQYHRAKPIVSGTRTNLILWCARDMRNRTSAQ